MVWFSGRFWPGRPNATRPVPWWGGCGCGGGVGVGVWLCVECCIVDASIFVKWTSRGACPAVGGGVGVVWCVVKCVRAHGGCLGIRSR